MNKHMPYRKSQGFTIIELLVVIVVIGILAAITIFAYNGITKKATDSSVSHDAQQIQTGLNNYATDNNGTYVSWASGNTIPAGLAIPSKSSNLIDVSVSTDKKSYCIRVYNPGSSFPSLANAYTVGSSSTACQNMGPSLASTNNQWVSVSSGSYFTCGLAVNGFVYCWGYNGNGELGIDSSSLSSSTTPMPLYMGGELAGKGIKQINSGGAHSCVIASDDKLYCWGGGTSGSLGNGTTNVDYRAPSAVTSSGVMSGKSMAAIDMGYAFMCATDTDGKMYCWGEDDNKQLGNNSLTNSSVPVIASAWGILDTRTVTSINVGNDHVCVIASGTTYCYGDNGSGQSGTATSPYTSTAINISGLAAFSGKTITDIEALGDHTCAITSNNQLYCWGYNTNGELGVGGTSPSSTPQAVPMTGDLAGKTVASLSGGFSNTCVLTTEGKAYCWGIGSLGRLGTGSDNNAAAPTAVSQGAIPNGVTLQTISAGDSHVCGIGSDKKIYCWGYNVFGQLGTGSATPTSINVPVQAIPSL